MGYGMTYSRFLSRNGLLDGGYDKEAVDWQDTSEESNRRRTQNTLRGDLRRLERDTLDRNFLPSYAKHAGVTLEQARALFELFFSGNVRIREDATHEDMWPDDPPSPYGPQWSGMKHPRE